MADEDTKDDVNPLQVTVDKLTAESQKYHKRAQEAEAGNKELTERLDKIEADTRTAGDAAAQKELVDKGKFDEALAAQKASMQGQLDAEKAVSAGLLSELQNRLGLGALKDALAAEGARPETLGQAAQLLQSRVEVSYADGKVTVTAKDESGNPLFVDGNAGTAADVVKAWLPENSHFKAPSGDGGGGHTAGGGSNADGITQASLLADPNTHQEWVAKFPPGESGAAFAQLPRK